MSWPSAGPTPTSLPGSYASCIRFGPASFMRRAGLESPASRRCRAARGVPWRTFPRTNPGVWRCTPQVSWNTPIG
jgi:hypothetical protein